jgi:hypothetical protein
LNDQPLLVSQMISPNSSDADDPLQKLRTSSATIRQRLVELQRLRDEVRIIELRAKRATHTYATRYQVD